VIYINVLSLFDGISCGKVALERAGLEVHKYYASEINDDSITVSQHNYPDTIQIGDVTLIDENKLKKLPKIDLLLAGSPCQDLSLAKSGRQNLNGERSKLFFDFVRILNWIKEHNNPEVKFILENVKMNEESQGIISQEVGVEPIKIDSELVSAQRRFRLYWTNIEVKELPSPKNIKIKDIVFDNTYKQFKDERIERTKVICKNYVKWDIGGKGHFSQQDRAYYLDGTMCTVPKMRPSSKLNIYLGGDLYRRCHPIEAERFQTLPDNYTACIKSFNKRMELVGDGWTVDVIVHILKGLK
jgi:site-specific DNA-cytosine methylase